MFKVFPIKVKGCDCGGKRIGKGISENWKGDCRHFPEGKRKKDCMENTWNGKPGKYRMEKIMKRAEMEIRMGKSLPEKNGR